MFSQSVEITMSVFDHIQIIGFTLEFFCFSCLRCLCACYVSNSLTSLQKKHEHNNQNVQCLSDLTQWQRSIHRWSKQSTSVHTISAISQNGWKWKIVLVLYITEQTCVFVVVLSSLLFSWVVIFFGLKCSFKVTFELFPSIEFYIKFNENDYCRSRTIQFRNAMDEQRRLTPTTKIQQHLPINCLLYVCVRSVEQKCHFTTVLD